MRTPTIRRGARSMARRCGGVRGREERSVFVCLRGVCGVFRVSLDGCRSTFGSVGVCADVELGKLHAIRMVEAHHSYSARLSQLTSFPASLNFPSTAPRALCRSSLEPTPLRGKRPLIDPTIAREGLFWLLYVSTLGVCIAGRWVRWKLNKRPPSRLNPHKLPCSPCPVVLPSRFKGPHTRVQCMLGI